MPPSGRAELRMFTGASSSVTKSLWGPSCTSDTGKEESLHVDF